MMSPCLQPIKMFLYVFLYFKAPLHTPVTKDKFLILTETGSIPVPIFKGNLDLS